MKVVIVFPVHNEELIIEKALDYALQSLPEINNVEWQLVVVENGSSDATLTVLKKKYDNNPLVKVLGSSVAAKGGAIKYGWEFEVADVYCFSDIDQSIDLAEVLPKILNDINEGYQVVTCVRQHNTRPLIRRTASYCYRALAKLIMQTRLNDLPCGMKAITKEVKLRMLPEVETNGWFFDSELLLRAERAGWKIKEISATWKENRFLERQKSLPMLKISWQYLVALVKLRLKIL